MPFPNELKQVRILLLGESGVGKSSLILSLISEQFIDQSDNTFEVPARLEPIVIPAEVTLENVPGIIIDYSKRESQNDKLLVTEIQRADVICLVYSMNDDESKLKISSYWLPKIYEINEDIKKPILIIGNKCDICEKNIVNDQFISNLVSKHPEIETCIECSAKSFKNVPEVFYYAQKSVLYPTAPLYNLENKELTQKTRESLIRIFKLIDLDNDGILNDLELNKFQLNCFGINIQPYTLNEVKTVIRKKSNDGLINNNLTLKGFLILNQLFVEKGRHETIWRILKHFGYDRYLNLSKDYITKINRYDNNCSSELTQMGFEYLKYLFNKYDKDKDLCLKNEELNDLFSVCPEYLLPKNAHISVRTNDSYFLTYDGFLSYWVMTTYMDINKACELLAYLGFSNYYDSLKNAFIVNRSKLIDIEEKKTYRNCFLCYVYGTKKCGKTAFLQGLLKRDLQFQVIFPSDEASSQWSCNLIQVQNIDKYLILKEINSTSDIILHNEYPPDLICLLYDSTDQNSFKFIAGIFLSIYQQKFTPTFIISTKCDQNSIQQNYPVSPEKFTEMYNLPPIQYFSASSSYLKHTDIYTKLVTVASIPKLYPMRKNNWRFFQNLVNSLKSNNNQNQSLFEYLSTNHFVTYSLLASACFTLSFILFRTIKSR